MFRRFFSVVLVAIATIPLWGANENTLTAESLVLPAGTTEAKLTVSLTNEAAISDIQFDLYLPTGFSVAYDEDDEARIEVNTTRTTAKRHSVDYLEKTGFTRIMCTSSKGYTFSGNSGPVVDIYLTIDASVAAGTYNVDIKNIAVSNSENTYTPTNTTSTITIEGGGGSSTDNNSLAAANLSFDSGVTEGVLSIELNNEAVISDIQFDLYLPTGFSVAYDEDDEARIEVNTTRTTAKRHSVDYLEKTGFTRIMCTSSKGYTFSGNSGPVVDVYITKDANVASGTYPVYLKNIAISNSENTYTPADATSQIVVNAVASHNIIYKVDGEVYETETYAEGAAITPIAAPTKEGYTFSGWSTIPATMGNSDITVTGSFTVNAYKLTYCVDEEEYSSVNVNYGALVTPIDNPQKTGYTFSGWDEVPATMPAHDVTVRGTFTINQYTVTFKVDGEVYKTFTLDYGAAITAPAAPTKEGYTFSGWQNVASTVPAEDVTYEASFTINKYTLKFVADGNVVSEESLDYGATITAPQAPDKIGYTFVTWGEVAATMPANNVTYTAQYSVNQYTVTFKIDGEIVKSETLDYGAAIVEPEVEQKEGATFSGWNTKVEETMPAHNVEYTGSYLINPYTITYIVDGEEYYHISVSYGSQLTPIDNPQKTGYTFSGWDEVPATMPAHDVTVRGTFTINQYTVTFKVDGEVYQTLTQNYGTAITTPEAPTKEGHTFDGWSTIPATMPANDVTVAGSFSPILASGITLNISTLSFTELNATQTLTATVSPANALNKSVTWTSSDANVATVDDSGLVTAKDYGTATITATTADGTNLSATCTVFVQSSAGAFSEGYYTIVSAGKGPGYYTGTNPGDRYNDEGKYALYNDAGLVKWKAYDESDNSFIYHITSDENGGWYIKNIEDDSFINRAKSDDGSSIGSSSYYYSDVTTSATKETPQLIEATDQTGKWTIRYKDNMYVYCLKAGHNGAEDTTSGKISIWGTNAEARQYGMNVWYFNKLPEATDIVLNHSELALLKGQTRQLATTVSPTNALPIVAWESSNPDVATVSEDGLVTAKSNGTATITATTTDGTNLSAMCEVTVLVNNKPDYYEIAEEPSATFELGKTYVLKNAFNGKFLSTNGGTATKVNQLENYEIWTIEAGSTADGTVYYRLATATVDGADKYFQYVNYGSKTWDDATPYDGYDWYEYAGFNGEFGPAETAQDFTILAPTASSDDSRTSVGDRTLVANSFVFTAKDEIMGKFFKLGSQINNAALEPWREDVAWQFYEATPKEDAAKALELALEAYGQLEMQGGDAPGFYPATAVEEYNGAVTAAREATNGDDAAKREAFAALKEAGKKTYETNPIVNGACYYIVSAGKGPGYYTTAEPEDPEKYNDEMAYGMYNADGFVNWGYFDYTQKYVYKFEKAEDGNWNIKNTADNSYIEKGTANYGQKVSTSATATMTQEFTLIKEGKFAMTWTEDRSGKYIYTLTASHNGSKNGDAEPGTISVWGTAAEAAKYGVNVWYLIPVGEVKVSSISLDKAMLELTSIGQTSQLTATVLPAEATNKSITWTSSNTSVAIVDANGLVTAKGYGTAIITATTTDGSNKAATCAVTVATNVDLTGIAHWEVIYDASYGYTFKDIATGLYMNTKGNSSTHQAITYNVGQSDKGSCWKLLDSRGNNVVSFNTQENYYLYNLGGWQGGYAYENKDDQRIFILAPDLSSAEPIQFVSDGNGYYYICMNGKYVAQPTKDIEDLKLKEITLPTATNISIDYSELSLEKGKTQYLKATVTPTEALQSVTWKSSNESVATVSENGLVTAKSNGTARITATTADGSNLSATCTVTVTIPVDGISLSNTSLTFSAIDSKETLTATVTPGNASNKNLEWTSSNPDVATVSSIVSSRGVVTAKGNGTATITARAKDGSNISASCTVTVTIPVDGISLSNTSLTFSALNTTQTLTATVSPSSAANKKLTWTSSNTSVATVSSNGVVTSKGNGTATITAKATDGSNISATCSVTVSAPIPVTGVSLNKTSLTFSALNTTQTLTATVTPSNASNKILTWTSSNTDVATVNIYGVVTSKGYGTATITATTSDGSNKSATCSVTVVIPKYTLKFVADGKVVSETSVEYGSAITAPNAPAKTGYTFVSWGNVAATMPAKDVTYTAQYKVNQYKLTYMIDGRVYKTYTLDYDSVINPEGDAEDDDYYYGWEEIPNRMPDHDVTVNAYITGIAAAGVGLSNHKYEIYTIDGKKLNNLQKGVNIIRLPNGKTKKVVIR